MALFINRGGPIKIRIGKSSNCHWTTIRKGEVVDLTQRAGLSYGFSIKTTEGQIGNKKVETKQIETDKNTDDFLKELTKIKGIGKETAEDIIRVFPKREGLKNTINKMEILPFRENICVALNKRYSK